MPKTAIATQKVSDQAHFRLGMVADPAPELILDKTRLAQLKLEMLNQEIMGLRNQINFAEKFQNMIREQHGIK